jgi:hypothetical protein
MLCGETTANQIRQWTTCSYITLTIRVKYLAPFYQFYFTFTFTSFLINSNYGLRLVSGQKWQDKISVVRKKLEAKKASAVVFTALDEIACELYGGSVKTMFNRFLLKVVLPYNN